MVKQIAGATPLILPRYRSASAIVAPLFSAETPATASPSLTARAASHRRLALAHGGVGFGVHRHQIRAMHDAQTIPWIVDALEERLKRLTTPKARTAFPSRRTASSAPATMGSRVQVTTHRIQRNERCVGLHVQTKSAALFGGSLDLLVCVSLSVHTEDQAPLCRNRRRGRRDAADGLATVRADGRADGLSASWERRHKHGKLICDGKVQACHSPPGKLSRNAASPAQRGSTVSFWLEAAASLHTSSGQRMKPEVRPAAIHPQPVAADRGLVADDDLLLHLLGVEQTLRQADPRRSGHLRRP